MLYLDGVVELHGLTLFRDYNDPALFYYLPSSPRLTTEGGQPMFELLIYRDAARGAATAQGGGFLTMTVDLGVSSALQETVRGELSSRFGVEARLASVPIEGGAVRISALDASSADDPNVAKTGPRFIENILASGKPSLYGDERAVFTATLSQHGATMMRAALSDGGASPVAVVYDLQYHGLKPAYEGSIVIKFQQSYSYLHTRAQMNTLWFKTDIDRETEELTKQGHIVITEVKYDTEDPSKAAERVEKLNKLAKELAQWTFFKPGLNLGEALAKDRGTLTAYDATTDAKANTAGFTSPVRAAFTGVGATADVGPPRQPGVAATPARPGGEAPAPAAPAAGGGGNANQPASGEPTTAVEAWNRAGRPQGAFLLREMQQDERQEITYNLKQISAIQRTIAPQGQIRLLEGAANMPGRIREVDLDDPFFRTIEGTVTTSADLAAAGISSMVVKLAYGAGPGGAPKDTTEFKLQKAGDSGSYRFFVDAQGSRELSYSVVVSHLPGVAMGNDVATEESLVFVTTTRNLDIDPAAVSSTLHVRLQAAAIDWKEVKQIQVEVRYDDGAGIHVASTKILTEQATSAALLVRPKDPHQRTVTANCTLFYADGETDVVTIAHDGDEVFVINQPADRVTAVDLVFSDPLERYGRAIVELARPGTDAPDVLRSVTMTASAPSASWSFRRHDGEGLGYRYKVSGFLKNGAVQELDWSAGQEQLLVVGDRAAGMLSVTVMILGDLASANWRAVELKLSYPDAPDWADKDLEHVFRSGTETLTWRVPMTKTGATSYRYDVSWIGASGKTVHAGPITTSDEILLLDPLAPSPTTT